MNSNTHIQYARSIALRTYEQEMHRRGIPRTIGSDFIAAIASKWIGEKIGCLPDAIEPPTNQFHRGIFHSVDAACLAETLKTKIKNTPSQDPSWDIFQIMCLSAYQSHIELDSKTPHGVIDCTWIWGLLSGNQQTQRR